MHICYYCSLPGSGNPDAAAGIRVWMSFLVFLSVSETEYLHGDFFLVALPGSWYDDGTDDGTDDGSEDARNDARDDARDGEFGTCSTSSTSSTITGSADSLHSTSPIRKVILTIHILKSF